MSKWIEGIGGIIWGTRYAKRTRGSLMGDECVVCGKHTADTEKTAYIWASPATGDAYPADVAKSLPAEYEASGYPIGSDCLRKNPQLRACVMEAL